MHYCLTTNCLNSEASFIGAVLPLEVIVVLISVPVLEVVVHTDLSDCFCELSVGKMSQVSTWLKTLNTFDKGLTGGSTVLSCLMVDLGV